MIDLEFKLAIAHYSSRQSPELVKEYFSTSKTRRETFERVMLLLTEGGVVLLLFQVRHHSLANNKVYSFAPRCVSASLRYLRTNERYCSSILSDQHRVECYRCDV